MALVAETGPAGVVADENSGSQSAVSWAAIIGGALAAVAITLLLVALGSGIGLSSVSPWTALNPSATTFTLLAAVWLIIVQWLSSALGGYIAGRLRTKWAGLHTDEVFFRDTAHGFLAWALASVLVVAFATSSISSAVSSAGRAISNVAGSAASTATQAAANQSSGSNGYFLDTLFRKDQPDANAPSQDARAEAAVSLPEQSPTATSIQATAPIWQSWSHRGPAFPSRMPRSVLTIPWRRSRPRKIRRSKPPMRRARLPPKLRSTSSSRC